MYKSLQACRAIAAVLVVLFHLGGTLALKKYFGIAWLSLPFSFGGAGVEFFFVLSGFIIFLAHCKDISKPERFSNYIRKRFIRIYPTYWAVFLSVFFLALSSSSLRNSVACDVSFLVKSFFLIPQDKSIVGGTGAAVIIVAWTLQYEMLFYLLFASLVLNRWLFVFASSVLFYIYFSYSFDALAKFPFSFLAKDYILLFAMGMMTSYFHKKFGVKSPAFYLILGAIILLILATDTILQSGIFTRESILLHGVGASLFIFGLVKLEEKGVVFGKHKWIQLLGDSSYALYLIHFPLISILCKASIFVGLQRLGMFGVVIASSLIFAMCILTSVAFHLLIERPMIGRLKRGLFIPQSS